MNFASLKFWMLLAVGFVVLWLLRRLVKKEALSEYDQWALFSLSLGLLAGESLLTAGIFLYVSILSLVALKLRWGERTIGLVVVVVLLVAPLFFFKYSAFFFEVLKNGELGWKALIPMGISFYSFQAIAMIVDSRRHPIEDLRISRIFNFLGFFPQIVAGPIERTSKLMPQIRDFVFTIRSERLDLSLRWIVLGLFFKVVLADNFASSLTTLVGESGDPFAVSLRIVGLGFRIYFDFAGYSFIAYGLAYMLGVDLTLNFRSPYLASSPQEFWRRWHITLSTWIRDYLYIPLGGSRTSKWPIVLVIVFTISGLWHGAGWNFLLWGLVHGVGLVAWRLIGARAPGGVIGWGITQFFVFVAWLPFFTSDIVSCLESLVVIFNPKSYYFPSLSSLLSLFDSRGDCLVFIALLSLSGLVLILEYLSEKKCQRQYSILMRTPSCLIMIFLIVVIGSTSEGEFVYFNF